MPRSATECRTLEARREKLEAELKTTQAPAPRLHPNLPALYRERVSELTDALDGPDAAATREALRALIEEIRLVPDGDGLCVEIRGELAGILGLAGSGATMSSTQSGANAVALARQVKMVAGTRRHRDLKLPPIRC